jgi:hypothetical protein
VARLEIRKLKHISRVEIAQRPITIGRSSQNEIVLRDESVSRDHCIIEIVGGCAKVRDLGSRTGTFVNSMKIAETVLRHRDRIAIGPFVLEFRDSEGAFGEMRDQQPPDAALEAPSDHNADASVASDLQQLEAVQGLMEQQTAQIAELTAGAASLHSQVMDKTQQITSLQSEVESLVQRQRHTEATRQTALDRIDRTERRLAELATNVRSLDDAACRLAAVQEQLAHAERAWAQADEHAARDGASTELINRRNQSSAALDRLNRQRDAAIDELQRAIAQVRRAAEHTPLQSVSDHETEAKPPTSARQWWRFGARRHA